LAADQHPDHDMIAAFRRQLLPVAQAVKTMTGQRPQALLADTAFCFVVSTPCGPRGRLFA
jgi:hypothetical protein